ncbi:hypothetical protein TanjilG_24607 [Lupinus angustifolius]|uniref:Uncharacterized protein n=1 Tax=Lupinus angustifolius TaxID=3871 RepID=A0A4P1RK46_LUPAN|nr:hypothetical protein TanjilG_24607 [Lupinus angustifolius]
MATVHDDDGVGFEDGMFWLPSHVLDEACDTKAYMRNCFQKVQNYQHMHQKCHHKSPRGSQSQYSKSWYQRPRHANGGPGMQVLFLKSSQRSCGTGVFLPQRATTNFHPTKKPACAPVLLPARVVEALNLNVHALVDNYNPRCRAMCNNNSAKKKSDDQKDASKQCYVISQKQSSPEIFLPKEWTY